MRFLAANHHGAGRLVSDSSRGKYDASKLMELKPAAHAVMPATMPHFGLHKAGNVVEVYREGPFIVNFVNPEDDPGRARKK